MFQYFINIFQGFCNTGKMSLAGCSIKILHMGEFGEYRDEGQGLLPISSPGS